MAEEKDKAVADGPADSDVGDAEIDDVELSEAEVVAHAAAKARPVRKSASTSTSAKGHATRKRSESTEAGKKKRTTPIQFVREAIAELKKVVWPTGPQLQQYFVVVLVFVLIMIAIVFLLDLGLGTLILKLLG